jgi:hypothetical protein
MKLADPLERIDFEAIAKNEQSAERFRAECADRIRHEKPFGGSLLSAGSANVKLRKSGRDDLRIVSLSLAHGEESGISVCPSSTPDCRAFCVGGTGLAAVWPTIREARIKKTRFVMESRLLAIVQIVGELELERRAAERDSALLVARLNCFSDLPWESPKFGCIPQLFLGCGRSGAGGVLYYDYTAILSRVSDIRRPQNYSLCGSWKDARSTEGVHRLLTTGHNCSIPFAADGQYAGFRALLQPIPRQWRILGDTFNVIDGDENDIRAFDPGPDKRGYGNVVALRFKSSSNASRNAGMNSEFVVRVQS